jgi:glycosyltransferase involved in cell wall biosynthesis
LNTIVFVVPSLKTGGGNRVFFELANCLVLKYKVTIILPNNNLEGNTFHIHEQINFVKIGEYSTCKKIINIIRVYTYINKNHRQDKVIISDPIMCLFLECIKNRKNLYRFIQADDYRIYDDKLLLKNSLLLALYKYFCKRSYKQKMNYIFNSRFVYEQFIHDSCRNDVNFNVVHPAINHSIFCDKYMDIRNKELNICLVGRKHPWKGLQIFIDMYNTLDIAMKNKINNVFIISHDDLSAFEKKHFILIKPKSDVEIVDIYNKSRIFISASWMEGFGLPGLEAMACGCILLTSDCGGCREYAIDKQNALFFTARTTEELRATSIEELRATLAYLLETEKSRLLELVENGKKTSAGFSWEKSALQLETILFK